MGGGLMTPIISGTTLERIIRTTLLFLLFGGFSAWSFRDAYYAYPRENMERTLKDKLGVGVPDPPPALHKEITAESVEGIESIGSLSEISARLGVEPYRHPEHENMVLFFGPGGSLPVEVKGDAITPGEWIDGPSHGGTDLALQKVMAYGLAPVGIALLIQLIRVLTTRVRLDEGGLSVRGKPAIPFDAMTGFSAEMYKKRGWLELHYLLNGQAAKVRLDDYVIKEFRTIIEAICERKGFDNPLPPPEDEEEIEVEEGEQR
jgi:hypothetical protein